MEGISSLTGLDQFQEIDPMERYVSVEENWEHQRYLSADREYVTEGPKNNSTGA